MRAVGDVLGIDLGFDPLGDFITDIWESAATLMVQTFGHLFEVGQADYSASWFLSTYRMTFGLAISVYSFLVILNIIQLGTGRLDPGQFGRNMTYRTVGFFYGVSFGPLIGRELAAISASLAKNFLIFAVTGSAHDITENKFSQSVADGAIAQLGQNLKDTLDGGMAGGQLAQLSIGFILIITLIALTVLVMLVTMLQYILGAFFPLLFVYIMSAKHRAVAKKALGLTLALYLIVPAASLIIAIVIRAFGSINTNIGQADPFANLMFAGSLAFGLILAIAVPLATFMMLVRSGMSVAQAGHEMVTAGAGAGGAGAVGAGGAARVAMSNAPIASTAPRTAATAGLGVAATAATGGAAAPAAAVGSSAGATAGASAGAGSAAGASARAGATAANVGTRAGSTGGSQAGGASSAAATNARLRAGTQMSGTAEELARRPQVGVTQGTQNAAINAQHLDENEQEAVDR